MHPMSAKNVIACDELDVWENHILVLYVVLISISKWRAAAIIIAYKDAHGILNKGTLTNGSL